MLLPIIAFLQSAAPTDADEVRSSAFRRPPERCQSRQVTTDEVVVCGRRDSQSPYRIGPQPEQQPAIPDAEFRLSDGVAVKLHAEEGEVGGIPTNRAMVSVKIKF